MLPGQVKSILPFAWLHRLLLRYLAIRSRGHTYLGENGQTQVESAIAELTTKSGHEPLYSTNNTKTNAD
jgi:hypothetical protein